MNKSRNYARRPMVCLPKRKRSPRRKSVARFFVKLAILLVLFGLIGGVGYWGGKRIWAGVSQARGSNWRAKTIVVSGVTGPLQRDVTAAAGRYKNQPVSRQDAATLRNHISKTYPMLSRVAVQRGLFSGKLTVTARHRTPLAKFVRRDGVMQYIDADSTVYTDPHPSLSQVPLVELDGPVTDKLSTEFIELVQSTLKLNKELNFTRLRLNLTDDTVQMYLPDNTELNFGSVHHLKDKALRGAQVLTLARKKYKGPFVLDFRFFENGKIFLRQNAL